MKKYFIVAALCIASVTASAQFVNVKKSTINDEQRISFGIRAGLNVSKLSGFKWEDRDSPFYDEWSSKNRIGGHFGVVANVPIAQNFYVQPGLYFTAKGSKLECEFHGSYWKDEEKYEATPYYLEIPVLASYRIPLSDDIKIHINAGPYIAYGLGGKLKELDSDDNDDIFGSDGIANRFDFGLNVGAGVSFKKIYAGLGYEFGLLNLGKEIENYEYSMKTRNFFIQVGYDF